MFPIPWNKAYRKKDGSLVNIDDAMSGGGGGGYTLPPATASRLGGVKIGSGVTVQPDGTISVSGGGGGGTADYGTYTMYFIGVTRGIFARASIVSVGSGYKISALFSSLKTSLPQQSAIGFSTNNYDYDDCIDGGDLGCLEYYGYIDDTLITDGGLVLLGDLLASAGTSLVLSDSISNYDYIAIQGCYDSNGHSEYDTTLLYFNPVTDFPYWFGVKDRNTSYSGEITFTDDTHATLSTSRRIKIYGGNIA